MKKRITLAMLLLFSAQAAFARSKPHYVFLLPDGYRGWVQVISQSKDAPPPVVEKGNLLVDLDDNGVFRTTSFHTMYVGAHDEFFYKSRDATGKTVRVPVPANDYCNGDSGLDTCFADSKTTVDCFTVGRSTVGKSDDGKLGNSWFFFVGPPEDRERYKWAGAPKYRTEPHSSGMKIDQPEFDPKPGRIKND
jgi:hypothetical protein